MENSLLHIARKAAVVAGNLLLDNYSVEAGIESNIGKDIKTKADLASNKVICEILRPTGINIVSEELFKDHSQFLNKVSGLLIHWTVRLILAVALGLHQYLFHTGRMASQC